PGPRGRGDGQHQQHARDDARHQDRAGPPDAGSARTSTARPLAADTAEPAMIPTFAASSAVPSSASPATKRAMVKPIPARIPPPASAVQPTPAGRCASPTRTAIQLKTTIPSGFPNSSPAATATATGSVKDARWRGTPAFARAKTGMMTNPTQG